LEEFTITKSGYPEIGDCVLATVKKITSYGAYVLLDEYDKDGLLHISEVSSTWIRNIRNFVRENQKVVLKVLTVDTERGHIDLSLRRVSGRERKDTLLFWKRDRKAESMLRSTAEKLGLPYEEIYEKAGVVLEQQIGIYDGLEKTLQEGISFLLELGIPEDIATALAETSKEKIKIPKVKKTGKLELTSGKPNGVILIKDALLSAKKTRKTKGTKVNFSVISAPIYRIEVLADDYKKAEETLKKMIDITISQLEQAGGSGSPVIEK
jgi:translation initiation factor 2 subunit 1